MKLLILSDLHTEFADFVPEGGVDFDVCVLAGDIATKGRAGAWAAKAFAGKPVVLVLGNHDYWGTNLAKAVSQARSDCENTTVHLLHNNSVVIDGVRFVGGTLWTDYRLTGNRVLSMIDCQQTMVDHKKIRTGAYKKVSPSDLEHEHDRTLAFFKMELARPFDGPSVVVTHHAPAFQCLEPRYQAMLGNHVNSAFASSLEYLMSPDVPLWIHGHVHNSIDMNINGTRVVCNPRGYVGEEVNPVFDPRFVVEV
jgi:Icc-related predicted phosphoesterase